MKKDKKNLKIAFMGTPDFSVHILESLLQNKYSIVAAFSQEDKIVGRKKIIKKSPVKIFCEENEIPIFTPKKMDKETVQILRDKQADLIILVAYGKILPKIVLETPPLGAINIHPSLLPKFRGPSPVQNALLEGEKITGSTIMLMDEGVDTGDILRQKKIPIDDQETYIELKKKLAPFSADLLAETLDDFLEGKIIPQKQDSSKASYCRLIKREDGKINWNENGKSIFNRFRAFFGWPGIYALWNSGGIAKRIKLNRISLIEGDFTDKKIGETFLHDDFLCVKCGAGAIAIHEMQLEGKVNMPSTSFINGYKNFLGAILE
jgi:methionyl-tRNA formyltransferase